MRHVRYHVHMDTKTTISITEARSNIFDIAEDVQKPGCYYTLTENGRPKVVLMSAEEFESWMETMEVVRTFPNLDRDVAETDAAVKSGEYKKWSTLEDLLAKEGFFVADKSTKKYGVHAVRKTRSPKKNK